MHENNIGSTYVYNIVKYEDVLKMCKCHTFCITETYLSHFRRIETDFQMFLPAEPVSPKHCNRKKRLNLFTAV